LRFLLDTNACVGYLNDTNASLVTRMKRCAPSELALCSMVKAELLFGARRSSHVSRNLGHLADLFGLFISLPFDDRCAEHYGLIRADLSREGRVIGPDDLMIAATARAHDLTLVTHNVGVFSRIVGLRIDDWETPG